MRNPFRKQTVDTITAPITKIVDQLNRHVEVNDDLAGYHHSKIDHHHAQATAAVEESNKASRRSIAISKLFG